jgi:hypothetical protein
LPAKLGERSLLNAGIMATLIGYEGICLDNPAERSRLLDAIVDGLDRDGVLDRLARAP